METNRKRMRYRQFRAEGLCAGSGGVESSCKSLVRTRLHHAGMHRTTEGANAIIALRSCIPSGRYEDGWEEQATRNREISQS